ncbi:hypothetical protein MKX03_003984 [Papaver bracteatum]|nr:hypothetical protein MKX03_003984 [Papaver bracteatum]
MDSSSSHPRRSPRLSDLAPVRELTETDTEKERRLRRAQYKARLDSITEGERQERNERRRVAYRARISAANRRPDDHEASCKLTEFNLSYFDSLHLDAPWVFGLFSLVIQKCDGCSSISTKYALNEASQQSPVHDA